MKTLLSFEICFSASKCNKIFYLFVANGNLTLLFFTREWLQLKLTNQWLLFPRSEWKKQEANLAARPKWLEVSFFNIFSGIWINNTLH